MRRMARGKALSARMVLGQRRNHCLISVSFAFFVFILQWLGVALEVTSRGQPFFGLI